MDVIREIGELRDGMCTNCAARVDAMLVRWKSESTDSFAEGYEQLLGAFFTDHEWRDRTWGSKLSPELKQRWKAWVADLYQKVCIEGREIDS